MNNNRIVYTPYCLYFIRLLASPVTLMNSVIEHVIIIDREVYPKQCSPRETMKTPFRCDLAAEIS